MTPEIVIDVFQHTLWIIVLLVSILLLPALGVGLLVAVFQAATSINEMTLSFIPKLMITFATMLVAGPYMLNVVIAYMEKTFADIPYLIG